MDKKELRELRQAIMSMCKPEHDLYIECYGASVRWNGSAFSWTAPSGTSYKLNASQVIQYIGDGMFVKYYSYDFCA